MSVMFEVYYKPPRDDEREASLTDAVSQYGGRLDFCEDPTEIRGVVLTYEFDDWDAAKKAAVSLREKGEHVEGPAKYGDS